ncbi:MAG: YIP1 family protein [Bacteroidota bacterium]|nr:YIP1 family protein [Bacteroidota bacterium]
MINCPVCHSDNDELEIVCKSCRGFLQTKVDNINLFETLWGLIENPLKAFKNIALARTKNYIIFLSSLIGVSFLFLFFGIDKSADTIDGVASLFILGFLGGIPLGIFLVLIITVITFLVAKIFKHRISLRNIAVVIIYSAIPFVYDLVFLLPLKLLAFGISYFESSPSLTLINPTVHYIILSIEALLLIWFLYLFVASIKVLFSLKYPKSFVIAFIALSFTSGTIWLSIKLMLP